MVRKDHRWRLPRRSHDRGIEGGLCISVEDHAHRLDPRTYGASGRQLGIVSPDRSQADRDRIHIRAQPLYFLARELVADPSTLARGVIHLSVARESQLERHPGPSGIRRRKEKRSIELEGGGFLNPEVDLHAVVGEMA